MKTTPEKMNRNKHSTHNLGTNDIHKRLSNLSAMLKDISEKLSESNSAAKAYAIVQTALMLETINWEVMNEVTQLMIEVDACNIFPTAKETRVQRAVIVEATELANDILADMPIGYRLVEETQVGCIGNEIASENLASSSDEFAVTGTISNLRKIITKRNDLMAKFTVQDVEGSTIELTILPRSFAQYRSFLENMCESDETISFICDYDSIDFIVKEIQIDTGEEFREWLEGQQSDNRQEIVLTGKVVIMYSLPCEGENIGYCDILYADGTSDEIVVLPKAWNKYYQLLKGIHNLGLTRDFICELVGTNYILKEIKQDIAQDAQIVLNDLHRVLPQFKLATEKEFRIWLGVQETAKSQFQPGQRVILTKTLLDETTDVNPVHLYAGDEGVVIEYGGQLGFQPDRYGDITSMGRQVDGEFRQVLDFCVPAPIETEPDYSAPKKCEYCHCDEACIYKEKFIGSPTGYGWLCDYCNQYLSPAPSETGSES